MHDPGAFNDSSQESLMRLSMNSGATCKLGYGRLSTADGAPHDPLDPVKPTEGEMVADGDQNDTLNSDGNLHAALLYVEPLAPAAVVVSGGFGAYDGGDEDDSESMEPVTTAVHPLGGPEASNRSWYSPSKRRAGLGAMRRNELMSRTVNFTGFDMCMSSDVSFGASRTSTVSEKDISTSSGSKGSPEYSDSLSDTYEGPARASFVGQLLAVVERSARELWRRKFDVLLDIAVPLIFMAVSIALWAIWGTQYNEEMTYVSTNLESGNIGAAGLRAPATYDFTCMRQPEGTPTLAEFTRCMPRDYTTCDSVTGECETQRIITFICDGDSSMLPLPAEYEICRVSYDWEELITAGLSYYWRWLAAVPTLDMLIGLQWTALSAYRHLLPFIAKTMVGFAANTRYSAILCSGHLYFVGERGVTSELIAYMDRTSGLFRYVTDFKVYSSVAEVRSAVKRGGRVWAIVELRQIGEAGLDLVLHMNNSALPSFATTYDDAYSGGVLFDTAELYMLSGFNTLQQLVSEFYLNTFHDAQMNMTQMMAATATPEYSRVPLMAQARQVLPLIFSLAFLYSVSQQTKRIVLEKELRIREAMLIMGLKQWTLYVSEFIVQLAIFVPTCVLCVVMLKLTYVTKSDPLILLLIFCLFALTTIPLSGMIAAFFSKSRLASLVAPVVYFILVIPMFAMTNAQGLIVTWFSVFSPTGFAAALNLFLLHESGSGCGEAEMTSGRDNPTLAVVLVMLVADLCMYYALMLYLDAVMPKQWGTRKHPLFFVIEPVRWCCGSRARALDGGADGRAENGVFEDVGGDDDAVCINGLRKEYSRGGKTFVAVNNLYWGMREGEISVLLGHNGAGKTTVLNMMTGMVEPDAGDCYVYGYSVRNELERVRQQIGYCPQHNILWPNMTCYEHLWYYAALKGLRGAAQEEAISRMLAGVGLRDKRDYCSKMLSGGQKRKLSVAVAFVGGSRLVFLDEPTAGMDVGARRHTWTLLRAMAKYHTILLTTHFMDEADLLGDSVAIMSQGRLQCAGSNMFLKARLGVGYVLTLSVVAHVDRMTIAGMVREHVPSATRLGSGAGEMAFRLPMKTKAAFPTLLAEIESRGSQLGVNAYSVSATTLEEIFIQIAQQEEAKEEMERKRERLTAPFAGETRVCDSASVGPFENHMSALGDIGTVDAGYQGPPRPSDVWNVGFIANELSVLHSQFKAMLWKRLWNALRDRRTQFFQIVCPMLCVLLAMLLMLIKLFRYPAITLSSDLYGTTVEIDVAGCGSAMNLSIPFSSKAVTVQPPSATSTATLSSYMLETYNTHVAERYTGLVCVDAESIPMPFTTFNRSVSSVIYNNSGLHSNVIGLYNLYNGYYMAHRGNNASVMTTVVQAMPKTKTEVEVQDSIYALIISIVIMIPFTFIPSTFVSWIVKERECKARHLQNVSGLYFPVYWITNFLFDICCYVVTMLLILIVFAIFSRDEYIGERAVGATIVLFLLYGLSGVVMAYAVSFLFKEHSTAQNVVMLANFITGFLLVICVSMLSVFESTKKAAKVLPWIFRIVPSFCVGEGIGNLAALKLEEPFGTTKTPWSMSVVGWPCVYMAVGLPLYVFVTLFLDHPGRRQRTQRLFYNSNAEPEVVQNEDEDVAAERRSVLESEARQRDLVRVENLSKVYSNGKVAVRNITFGVRPGEVFGFLGTNGAGKTTTISILCQEIHPTAGRASICGNDIVMESRKALRCIGYCPQFDACLDLLTVEEHLELYAGVRAISYNSRKRVVEGLLALCELTNYRHTLAHALSGGNRRKLSVAISLIGGPRVVFLDEPSAGMDPVARRGMWTAIEAVADNSSVVLTTHHLEEVEALAHRVAIMVDGTLRCIGDKTHLKNKFGTGFEVNVRIRSDEEEVKEDIRRFFRENFPGSSLREYRARRLTFELPAGTKLSRTFKLMEEHALALRATDYSVSQTSIEQVFMQISEEAERQREAEEVEQLARATKGCCTCCC